jgi:hypothetical protein
MWKRYYFDVREDEDITPDDEGMELPTLEAVQAEAAIALAEMEGHSPKQAKPCGTPNGNRRAG